MNISCQWLDWQDAAKSSQLKKSEMVTNVPIKKINTYLELQVLHRYIIMCINLDVQETSLTFEMHNCRILNCGRIEIRTLQKYHLGVGCGILNHSGEAI